MALKLSNLVIRETAMFEFSNIEDPVLRKAMELGFIIGAQFVKMEADRQTEQNERDITIEKICPN